jgi:murein DD-endopeptidase MepM/ murein hydrolase activator NlpD
MAGAAIVTIAAGAVIPDPPAPDLTTQAMSVQDPLYAADRANRTDDRAGPAIAVDQGAPDVWLLPLKTSYVITTLYALRWGSYHSGVDLATGYGTPIYSTHAGIVRVARWYGGYGYCVIVDVGDGILVYYGHASRLAVTEGQTVKAGQLLSYVGSTGDSTGNHLHYEVRINNSPVDPIAFMKARGVDIEKHLQAATGDIVQ